MKLKLLLIIFLLCGCHEDYKYIGLYQRDVIIDPRAENLQSDVTTSQKTVRVWGVSIGNKGDPTFENKKEIAIVTGKNKAQFLEKIK